MLIVLGASALQIPLIRAVRDAGHDVMSLDNDLSNVGHRHATRSLEVSTRDVDGVLELARRERAVAVLTCGSDVALAACARASETLGLKGPAVSVVDKWCSKPAFRAHQRSAKLRHPGFVAGRDAERVAQEAASLPGPLIVKPSDRSGSRGVRKLESAADPGLVAAIEAARSISFSNDVCVEQFIEGTEYGGDCWVRRGRIIALFPTLKLMDGFIVRGHRIPALLPAETETAIHQELQDHIHATGYEDGPINFDIRVDAEGRPWIIEIAPRLGGNWIPDAIAQSTGVNVYSALVDNALDRPVDLAPRRNLPTATYVVGLKSPLTLKRPIDTERIGKRIPSLLRLEVDARPGDSVEAMIDSGQQFGRALIDLSEGSLDETIAALDAELTSQLGAPSLRRVPERPLDRVIQER